MTIESIGKSCTGCGACMVVCPTSCISMEKRDLGHVYPAIDYGGCIECENCVTVCHTTGLNILKNATGDVFACQAKDRSVLDDSSSGGVFSLLANCVLHNSGVIYGSQWIRGEGAVHIRIDNECNLPLLRRSKYVQSNMVEAFLKVKQDLDSGIEVLFVGTPCQVAALRMFLGRNYDGLITADLICHGVPSAVFFNEYLDWMEETKGKVLVEYNSRDKKLAGWSCLGSCKFENEALTALPVDDPYALLFNHAAIYRDSCYECSYANPNRVGDITLGDFWGAEQLKLGIASKYGVSVVIVNTEQGKQLFDRAKKKAVAVKATFEDASRCNQNLIMPSRRPSEYLQIETIYNQTGFKGVAQESVKMYKKDIFKQRIKRLLPFGFKSFMKKLIK